MIHEDQRRTLTSMPYKDGEIKVIIAKQDCTLGNHKHLIKTEEFTLVKGFGSAKANEQEFAITPGDRFTIDPDTMHSFILREGSVLVCICSHPYNPEDDYEK